MSKMIIERAIQILYSQTIDYVYADTIRETPEVHEAIRVTHDWLEENLPEEFKSV